MKTNRRNFLSLMAAAAAAPAMELPAVAQTDAELQAARLARDPQRPQFHFLPASDWMNDPNGPLYWKGQYHMFYQNNPYAADWGTMYWGHAVSPDMVHWRHLPIALDPTPGWADSAGCWTGTAIVHNGTPTLLYTGVSPAPAAEITNGTYREQQCLATSSDPMLRNWTKLPQPVITAPPAGMTVNGFRDPSPWRDGDKYFLVLGSGIRGSGGAVLLYESPDLRQWKFRHILQQREGNPLLTGGIRFARETWECPDFFPLGSKHVLITSFEGKGQWFSGDFDAVSGEFHAQKHGVLDYGAFYAPKTQLDKDGNRILWGWVQERRSTELCKAAGWAGVLSLPRILTLDADGTLRTRFAPELAQLREEQQRCVPGKDEAENQARLTRLGFENYTGEIQISMRRPAEAVSLSFNDAGTSDRMWLQISYNPQSPDTVFINGQQLPLTARAGEGLNIHIYVDGSVMEVVVNQNLCYTQRYYPVGGTARRLGLGWAGSMSSLQEISVWPMQAISSDRLTT